jgi:hypothetical protein
MPASRSVRGGLGAGAAAGSPEPAFTRNDGLIFTNLILDFHLSRYIFCPDTRQERHHGQSRRRSGEAERCVHAGNDASGWRQENDYRTTGNTGNSKEWPRRKIAGGKGAKGGNPLQQFVVRDSSTKSKASLRRSGAQRLGANWRKPAETFCNARRERSAGARASGCPS